MSDSIQPPSVDWFREWAEQQNRKREQETLIQLELPLPELIEQASEPAITNRGVYNDAMKSIIDDVMEIGVIDSTTFQF
jgi:glucan phosphorylase